MIIVSSVSSIRISAENSITHPGPADQRTRQESFDQTDGIEWIETQLEFTFEDPIRFTILARFKIHEVFLPDYYSGSHLTADEIRKQYSLEVKSTPVNPPIQLALNQKVYELFNRILNYSYPGTLYILESPKIEINTLQHPVDANMYDPPVEYTQYCSYMELSKHQYFSATEQQKYDIKNLEDLIEGTLKMGATITQDILLYANAGHTNTYIFKVKQFTRGATVDSGTRQGPELVHDQLMIDHDKSESEPSDKSEVKFTLNNLNGQSFVTSTFRDVQLYAKEPNRLIKEDIDIIFHFDFADFDRMRVNDSKVTIKSIRLDRLKARIPSNFTNLDILSSDGIRLFYFNGIVNLSKLEEELDVELAKIEAEFDKTLNTTDPINLGMTWDFNTVGNLTPLYHLDDTSKYYRMGDARPVCGYLKSTNELKIGLMENTSVTLIKGMLNAGARADLDISVKTRYSYKYNLTLPTGFKLRNKQHSMLDKQGRYSYILSKQDTMEITIESTHAPVYKNSNAEIEVVIDVYEIEVLSFTEYKGNIKVVAKGTLHYLEMEPNSRFAKALPKEMSMKYFNSDALRLIYSENLLDFEEYEDEMYSVIKENITNLLDEDLEMTVDFGKERLKFDGDIDHMDGNKPITFQIKARGKMHISENRLVNMGSFITKQIRLPTIGLKNWNVTYSLILPNYIDVVGNAWVEETEIDYTGPRIGQDKEHDNRYKVSITIHGQDGQGASANNSDEYTDQGLEINVNMDIDITLLFFLNKVSVPLVLSIILIIIVITLVVLRRLKKSKMDKMKREIGLEVDDEELLDLETEIHVEPQYQETEDYDWRAPRRGPRRGRSSRRGMGRMSKRFREFNSSIGISRGPAVEPQEDYSQRLRELVPKQKQTPKKRKRRPASEEREIEIKRPSRSQMPRKQDRIDRPKSRSKRTARSR